MYDKMMSYKQKAPKASKGAPKGGKGGKPPKRQAENAAAGSRVVVTRLFRVLRLCALGEPVEKFLRSEPKGDGKGSKNAPYVFNGKCAICRKWGHKAADCPDKA